MESIVTNFEERGPRTSVLRRYTGTLIFGRARHDFYEEVTVQELNNRQQFKYGSWWLKLEGEERLVRLNKVGLGQTQSASSEDLRNPSLSFTILYYPTLLPWMIICQRKGVNPSKHLLPKYSYVCSTP